MTVISNTTVLSNFASIGELDVLRRLFGSLSISIEVFQEIEAGFEEGYLFYAELLQATQANEDGWITLSSLAGEEEIELFLGMPTVLHPGEASSLAIAQNRGWLFLTDDKAARKQARSRGIQLSGTLGCLVGLVENELCTLGEANQYLERIIRAGFFSPISDLGSLVRLPPS